MLSIFRIRIGKLKHFTVGDIMAFSIMKMGNKNSQNLPFPLHDVDPM